VAENSRSRFGSWWETSRQVAPQAVLTERAREWAMRRVGQHRETVASVGPPAGRGLAHRDAGGRDYGQPLIEDPDRLDGVSALGVDEHVWARAGPRRRTGYATGIVEISSGRPPRLLDVVPGRTGKAYADWLTKREEAWRQQVNVAALDPFRGYATALEPGVAAGGAGARRLPCRQAGQRRGRRDPPTRAPGESTSSPTTTPAAPPTVRLKRSTC
jgi:Transposase